MFPRGVPRNPAGPHPLPSWAHCWGLSFLIWSKPPQEMGDPGQSTPFRSPPWETFAHPLSPQPPHRQQTLSPDPTPCLLPSQSVMDVGPEAQRGAAAGCGHTAMGQAEAGSQRPDAQPPQDLCSVRQLPGPLLPCAPPSEARGGTAGGDCGFCV